MLINWWNRQTAAARVGAFLILLAIVVAFVLILAPKPWMIPVPRAAKMRPEHYAAIYLWWAGLFNLLPLSLLALTTRFWCRNVDSPAPTPAPRLSRQFWIPVFAAMLLCAALNLPRLTYSFWDDEEYSTRRAVVGTYQQKDDGTLKFRSLPWTATLWYYQKPTNHILQSALSRLSNAAWQKIARPKGLQFWEPAVRFPAYIAGCAAIAMTAFVVARLGFPTAGAIAAILLALHPWYMRFVPEARGYTMVFFFMAANWLCLLRAADSAKWRWWLGFAITEFCLIYTWPGIMPAVFLSNVCLFFAVLANSRMAPHHRSLLYRWIALTVIVGMALFQLLLPCTPQFLLYLQDSVRLPMEWFWLRNVGSLLLTGSHWSKTGLLNSPYPEFYPVAQAHPVAALALLALAIVFVAFGYIRLAGGPVIHRMFALLWVLSGPLTYLLARLKGQYLYEWYLAFMIPGLVCLAALGMVSIAEKISLPPRAKLALLAILLAGYAAITNGQRWFLMSRPVQFMKESVLATRPDLNPHSRDNRMIVTVATIVSPEIYDPLVERAPSIETLAKLLREADEKNAPLFINQGFPAALKTEFPATHAMVNDPALFEKIADFKAVEEMLDRAVYRYRPGSIEGVDLARYGKNPPLNRGLIY